MKINFKKLSIVPIAFVLMLCLCTMASAEIPKIYTSSNNGISLYGSWNYTESVTAIPGEFFGPTTMNFLGNHLTASGNATTNTGTVNTVTIKLRKQILGSLYSTVATTTIPADGQVYTIFNNVSISPNSTYKFSYELSGSSDASAKVFIAVGSF